MCKDLMSSSIRRRVKVSVSFSAQNGVVVLGKAHTRSASSLRSLPSCPRNSANVCLVEHSLFLVSEGGMLATFSLHSSFLQAISAVMLWPVYVQNIPQASEHLCRTKLQTRCDICCACQSICPYIGTDSGMPSTVDPQKSFRRRLCMAVCQSGQPIPDATICRSIESVRMMACVTFA